RLAEVPMGGRGGRLHPGGEQFIDEAVVEVEPLLVGLAGAFRENPRPGDREPVRLGADRLHQRYVFLVPVVVVIRDVAVVAVFDVAWRVREHVPIDMPLPSSFHAPSIWYDDVPTPQ